jgi:hypothetical protein
MGVYNKVGIRCEVDFYRSKYKDDTRDEDDEGMREKYSILGDHPLLQASVIEFRELTSQGSWENSYAAVAPDPTEHTLAMSHNHSEMTACSAACKGKRPIGSVDPHDAGPPAKISKTNPGPEGDFQEEDSSSAGHVAPFVDVQKLKAHMKQRNSKYCNRVTVPEEQLNLLDQAIACCLPQCE